MRDLGPLINKGEKNGLNTWEVYVRGFTVVDPEVSKQINKGFHLHFASGLCYKVGKNKGD